MKNTCFFSVFFSLLLVSCVPSHRMYYNNSLEYIEEFLQADVPCFDSVSVSKDAFKEMISNIDTCIFRYDGKMFLLADGFSRALNEAWWHYRWKLQYDTDRDSVKLWDSSTVTFRSFLDEQDRPLYYIGRLNLSDDFDSYLIASVFSTEPQSTDESFPFQVFNCIYLINAKGDRLVTMIKLWAAVGNEYSPLYTFSTLLEQNVFCQKEANCLTGDYHFSIWNPETWFLSDPTHGVRFRFNSDGKVEIL